MFFDDLHGLLRVAIVSLLAYAAMVLVLRIAGKRSLAKLNAFDLVVTVALGSTLATVLLSKDVALGEGVLAFAALASLQWLVSRLSVSSAWFRTLARAKPRLLLENGEYRRDAMAQERVTKSEIDAAVRNAGHGRLEAVVAVVLETDGSMSVIVDSAEEELTALRSVQR
ncbi:Membrane protein [Sphingobium herbicidovorans NBRC 16415]|uniref:Membrane protein n=1 Tax=Sphingobium herbicidovorans (strain ATCC 700291 / DSM 11019 / CCUG 56400 / KCTC 2939 / LMG 18315 / NBRC 16415 / MH) TaxID=1219045 RepID=A0A086P7V0_SPHHM|nr:YetF domain-containing protein [Sphingobium herbicidovorans]KFG89468.1 Membrane protein [Sphingobium herbicidovorans NBRC 16415]